MGESPDGLKKARYTTRDLVTMAVFGTLWGVVELSVGSIIKALNVPMAGMTLGAIGLAIALIGRLFVPKRGSVLFIGLIALFLKVFSISSSSILGPMIGIGMEALLAEIVVSLAVKPNRLSYILSEVIALLWVIAQPFVTSPILYGRSVYVVWLDLVDKMTLIFGFNAVGILLGVYILIHVATGVISGIFAWDVGQKIARRMRVIRVGGSAT